MPREYIIYCDESTKRGRLFSNFYGGALVSSDHVEAVRKHLQDVKDEQNLGKELKWVRISANYETKYLNFLKELFDLIEGDIIKYRVMFTQNIHIPILTPDQIENSYFLLYYQFIKHAFGLRYSNAVSRPMNIRIYPDNIPHTREKTEQFKSFIANMSLLPAFRAAHIRILRENIAEIDSAEHILAQCVDIIPGAMQFRLNRMHEEIPTGERYRGKRTRAKERIYKYIRSRINSIYPNFNIGITTGLSGDPTNRWNCPYRHWRFIPKQFRMAANRSNVFIDDDDE